MATTLERLTKLMIDATGVPHSEIKPEASFANDLGLDSLDAVQVVMSAEEEFEIEIGDDDAEGAETVADMVALIDRLVAAKVAA